MKINKPKTGKTSDRSVKEDLQRLDEAGINLGDEDNNQDKPRNPQGIPDTKKQQQTGDTERSDRRL